jgi:hypothetical protein
MVLGLIWIDLDCASVCLDLAGPRVSLSAAAKWPDGQITSDLRKIMSSPEIKNISLFQKRELGYINAHPVPLRVGVGRRHDEGRVAVDAEAATDARG